MMPWKPLLRLSGSFSIAMLIEGKSVCSAKPVLSLRDLWVSYPKTRRFREALRHPFLRSQVTAIQGVSLDIYEGEILTVVGANGAGKTTLCRTVAGLLKDDSAAAPPGARPTPQPAAETDQLPVFCPRERNQWRAVIRRNRHDRKA